MSLAARSAIPPQIPVSVLIVTRNEERNIARCLKAAAGFAEIIVIDSHSDDRTCAIARECGARVEMFAWNGHYPKKRQWCLDNLNLAHDWVLWLDADEVLTPAIISEIARVFARPSVGEAGFFLRGQYVWGGKVLRYGMVNNKIALINRHKMAFPIIDDLDIEGMGEIEGHYQPILTQARGDYALGQIAAPLLHFAYEDKAAWAARHRRYAEWEAHMTRRNLWPVDPVSWRQHIKRLLRHSIFKPHLMFLYSYIWKRGFLDGRAGFDFAYSRYRYYKMCLSSEKDIKNQTFLGH